MIEKKAVLVAGGGGYIGSAVSWACNAAGYKVVVVDRKQKPSNPQPWADYFCLEIEDKQALENIFKRYQFDSVVHCAALTSLCDSVLNPIKYYQQNFLATLGLLETMGKAGVRKFVFASSAAVYGAGKKELLRESDLCRPISPYGKSKFFVEQSLVDFEFIYGIKSVVLRYFNVAGAIFDGQTKIGETHEPETHLIPRAVERVAESKPIEVFGFELDTIDGSAVRDFVHVADVARANVLALDFLASSKSSEIFNISTGKGFSVLQILDKLHALTGKMPIIKQALPRQGEPEVLLADFSKAREMLGWRPLKSNLDEIIKSAFCWHKTNFYKKRLDKTIF